jgi:sortase B
VSLSIAGFTLNALISELSIYNESSSEYEHLKKIGENDDSNLSPDPDPETPDEISDINHDALLRENPDYAGWLKIEETLVDYPIAVGEKYLYRTFKGKENRLGTPFGREPEEKGGKSTYLERSFIKIYGHNARDASMFGSLHGKIHDINAKDNKVRVDTSAGKRIWYKVIGSAKVSTHSKFFSKETLNSEELQSACKESNLPIPSKGKKVICFITCDNSGNKDIRLVVIAESVKSYNL